MMIKDSSNFEERLTKLENEISFQKKKIDTLELKLQKIEKTNPDSLKKWKFEKSIKDWVEYFGKKDVETLKKQELGKYGKNFDFNLMESLLMEYLVYNCKFFVDN